MKDSRRKITDSSENLFGTNKHNTVSAIAQKNDISEDTVVVGADQCEIQQHPKKAGSMESQAVKSETANNTDKTSPQLKCSGCSKVFKSKKGLKKHAEKHHPKESDDEEDYDDGASLATSFRTSGSGTFHPCPYTDCNKFFNRPHRLKTHLLSHTGEKPFVCEVSGCNRAYARTEHLKRHVANNHKKSEDTLAGGTDESSLINSAKFLLSCSKCPKEFASQDSLKKHMKTSHVNPMRYGCPTCGLTFHKHNFLKAHIATKHEGKAHPYECHLCHKTFKYPTILKNHIKEKHEKQHACDQCEAKFEKFLDLRRHIGSAHSKKYPCEVCHQVFHTKHNWRTHAAVHADTRQVFHCPHAPACKRTYYDKKNLQKHIRACHESDRFPCKYEGCTAKLFSRGKLRTHMQTQHGPDDKRKPCGKKRKQKTPKTGPDRAPRHDKGVAKKSMVSELTGMKGLGKMDDIRREGQGGTLDINQLNKELASLPLLTSPISDSEEGLATPSNAKLPSPPSRSSLVSTATPVFQLRPKTAKKTSKDYLLGMLSRECPSLTETPVHLATETSKSEAVQTEDLAENQTQEKAAERKDPQPKKTFNFLQYAKYRCWLHF